MKILSNKKFNKMKTDKEAFDFMSKGFKANMISLDYQSAMISIMEELGVNEIELDEFQMFNNRERKYLEIEHNPVNNKQIIRIKTLGDSNE